MKYQYLIISFICFVLVLILEYTGTIHFLEMKMLDFRYDVRSLLSDNDQASEQIVIIGVDDESIKQIQEPFILWDTLIADIVEKTSQSGARVIGLDIIWVKSIDDFIQRNPEDKNALKKALLKSLYQYNTPVIMATGSLARKNSKSGDLKTDSSQPLEIFGKILGKQGFGMVNTFPDSDNYIRRARLYFQDLNDRDKVVPAFFTAIADRYDGSNRVAELKHHNSQNIHLINYQPQKHFPVLSFTDVLKEAQSNNQVFFTDNFKNKIVLLGFTNASGDILPSPLSQETPGVLIHAHTIDMLINQNFLEQTHWLWLVLVLLISAVMIVYYSSKQSIITTFFISLGLVLVYSSVNIFLFNNNVVFPFVAPLLFIIVCFSVLYIYRFVIEEQSKRRLAKFFRSYVNDQVVKEILNTDTPICLKGKRENMCILFSDIRGFTTFSEKRPPEEVVATLNQYFSAMTQVILDNQGTVDKFIGDGLMAFFGAPLAVKEPTLNAAKAALQMREKLAELNRQWQMEGKPQIDNGIGLHTGEALVGNIGSEKKMEYTVIGDSVNTASRVEGQTKSFQAPILMSKDSYFCIREKIEAIYKGEAKLKGRANMDVYELKSIIGGGP